MMRREIQYEEILNQGVWSPALYQNELVSTKTWLPLRDFLDEAEARTKGFEPGSEVYVTQSPIQFLRTKAFNREFALLYPKGDAIVGISPHAWNGKGLKSGDVLVVKDSNVGEVAVVPDGDWSKTGWSNGIAKANISKNRDFIIGFLKFGNFQKQVEAMTPRGATIKHAGDKWLNTKVPLPAHHPRERVMRLIEVLTRASLALENKLVTLSGKIQRLVSDEILGNQKENTFLYMEPRVSDLTATGRFDAAFHSEACKKLLFLAQNYIHGSESVEEAGFNVIPGPSLEIKIIKKRVDSNDDVPGYYRMFIPKNISEYGTMITVPFMGTPAKLPLLEQGDVLVGEAGFRKGRSYIFIDPPGKATTNAHGLIVRRIDKDLRKSVAFRCIFDWYRSTGLIDLLAVGGSGGHFSPSYFKLLALPKLPEEIQDKLLQLYVGGKLPLIKFPTCHMEKEFDESRYMRWLSVKSDSLGVLGLSRVTHAINEKLRMLFVKLADGEEIEFGAEVTDLLSSLHAATMTGHGKEF